VDWTIVHPNDLEDRRSVFPQWEQAANELDVDIHLSTSKAETKAILRELKPDIAFVCGWYQLLDSQVLGMIPSGAWGIHNSLLPKYRGGSPLTWSIIQGDEFVGSSVFQLSDNVDSGSILHQISIRNEASDDVSTILEKIESALLRELPDKWLTLLEGTARLTEQNEQEATYSGQRIEWDGLIDWSKEATDVHNFVRAQSRPYPCAFTFLGDLRLRLLRTRVKSGRFYGTPGQVLQRNSGEGSVLISTGNQTAIEIVSVLSGEHSVAASSAISSTRSRLGRGNF